MDTRTPANPLVRRSPGGSNDKGKGSKLAFPQMEMFVSGAYSLRYVFPLNQVYEEAGKSLGRVHLCEPGERAAIEVSYKTQATAPSESEEMMAVRLGLATRSLSLPPTVTVLRYELDSVKTDEYSVGTFKHPERRLAFADVSTRV